MNFYYFTLIVFSTKNQIIKIFLKKTNQIKTLKNAHTS